VRRAFLWGEDSLTGKNYEHRKVWVINRLRELADIFAIEICAYAVMSNHYHLVLRVDRHKAEAWTNNQVVEQWGKLYKLPLLVARYQRGEITSEVEIVDAEQTIETWRDRLVDISWFMRCLNEHLARLANKEDSCTGRFWEGRFKSQALLDEAAVLTCMSYVDLNPVRADMAETPEESDFTSIQQRIRQLIKPGKEPKCNTTEAQSAVPLMPLVKQRQDRHENAIGFTLQDYLELIDWAGRAVRENKRGAIAESAPPILQRIGLEPERYLQHLSGQAATEQPVMLGPIHRLREAAELLERAFIKGFSEARRLYLAPETR
jgi:REP element-mobilizing transposase RayT